MQGKIEQAQPSKSGKTLSVNIGGTWYSTKHFELQNMIGQEITFQTSQSEFNGAVMHWLNDYTVVGASTTPSAQAFDAAHAQNQPPPMGQPAPPQAAPQASRMDREASIVAQALTKAVDCKTAEDAWQTYVHLYNKVLEWNPGDFDDSVPF